MKKRRSVNDAQGSVKLTKVDGSPLSEKEEAEAERLYRIYWEAPPARDFFEPITLLIKPLKEWLSVKFDALYDLVSLSEPNITSHMDREVFVDFFVRSSIEYVQQHLPSAINAAVKMVSVSMHDQVPAGIAKIGGMPTDEAERRYVASRKDLKEQFDIILQGFIKRLPHPDGRGGDRRSGAKLTAGERIFIAERWAALKPFWNYLISHFNKDGYEYDVWDWIKTRGHFKEQCAKHCVTSLHILDSLIPDVLKRCPYRENSRNTYWEKESADRMPERLYPRAFALRHAALEMGVSDSYDNLKKKLNTAGRAKRTTRKPRAREIKK